VAILVALSSALAQDFRITTATLSNGVAQIGFPSRADSYYLLHAADSLTATSPAVAALLGASGPQLFQSPLSAQAVFFRLEEIPLTSTNSVLGDPVPDAWKLQQGLSIFNPTILNQSPPGDTRTWYQIYTNSLGLAQLPLAYFPAASSTVIAGSTEADVPVSFSKPFTGRLTYHLSGTAVPYAPTAAGQDGDYFPPPGYVDVTNSTSALISIGLVQRQAVEADRSLLVALSVIPGSTTAYAITNNTSVHAVQIAQSLQGVYLGTFSITNGLRIGAQPVKMAIRPGSGGGTVAFFDVTGNPLLGDNFSIPASVDTVGFQLTGGFSRQLTNTPFARPLTLTVAFGATQTNGAAFITPATITANGLTASGVPYTGAGYLTLTRSQ
jgi:hypothetical protein